MKRALIAVAASVLLAGPVLAADPAEALWIRYPAISPDGTQICFEYRGDLWVVPAAGGDARPLTIHEAYDRSPVWSPDGATIAFASDRFGNFDVFTVPSKGGAATRLTFHSSPDRPTGFTSDGRSVLVASTRLDSAVSMLPTTSMPELYTVPVTGGRAKQLLTTPAELAVSSRDGKWIAYQDRKGYENEWRKHHRSSVARDIWIYDVLAQTHRKWTSSPAEDRNPVFTDGDQAIAWLSEESGSFNVWKRDVLGTAPAQALTKFATHPVRFLSAADAGTLAFTWNGELYTMASGKEPVRVAVRAVADRRDNAVRPTTLREGATSFAVSPSEREVAFIVRGEVFVASVEHGTTKRITKTPEQERSLAWGKDGKSLYYSAERGTSWGLWKASIARAGEENFFNATTIVEEAVLSGPDELFQPVLSPDGKKLAFLRNRDAIDVLDLTSPDPAKATKNVVPAARNYSYSDGDISYEWSPDSRWLAFTYVARRRWLGDVGVADVETGKIIDVTDSGYEEGSPHWSPDGRALFFASDRFGRRAHGSWGADGDLFAQYLTQDAFDRAALSREDFDLLRRQEEKDEKRGDGSDDKKAGDKSGKDDDGEADDAKEKPPRPVTIEFERRERLVRRATITSSPIGSYAVSADGENVVYFAKFGEKWDLWITRPRDHKTMKALDLSHDEPGEVVFGKKGKVVYVLDGEGGIWKANVASLLESKSGGDDDGDGGGRGGGGGGGGARAKPIKYAAEMTIDGPAERAYMFEHAWRQVQRKFYDEKLHGVDWVAMKANYARFLSHVDENFDFTEMLSELLGELNASHTGSGYRKKAPDGDKTAALGLIYDVAYDGDGLKVAEVVAGGPCAKATSKITIGAIVTAIDGLALPPSIDWAVALDRKQGKPVLLDVRSADGATTWQEVVKPIDLAAESNLLYERWIERCRAVVEKASGGRVGYVHVRGMNEASFRRTYGETLGRFSDVDALVLDTRFNGGGWLHDDLCGFLNGRNYLDVVPRGKVRGDFGSEPMTRWSRPVAVLMSEGNYSDAHLFPFAFKALGLGKLVGAPVAGTGTAVWWETLLDPTVYFGIPQVGMVAPDGCCLENLELAPDVLVYGDPRDVARGVDAQLLKAVETVLAEKRGK